LFCFVLFVFSFFLLSYVHRIGRTARAGARGNAISFVCGANEEDVLSAASALQSEPVAPFAFRLAAVEGDTFLVFFSHLCSCLPFCLKGFRYRVEDVLQQITRDQIKEARSNELKTEILRSAALKKHFEEHPRDLEVLNSTTRAKRAKMIELKHVPDYLRPTAHDNAQIKQAMNTAVVNTKKKKRNYSNSKKKKNDPLRSMKVQK
jgi:ATP-dependent RNA helicase DDX56/DBP9